MASLRATLEQLGVSAEEGIRHALPVRPPSLRELIRVARLPPPLLAEVDPDEPAAFESFKVEDPQGVVHGGGSRWFLSSQRTIQRFTIEGDDPFRPTAMRHGTRGASANCLPRLGLASRRANSGV
jgi:hypothetical protein